MEEKLIIQETKKYLILDYQDNNQVYNLLNDWYKKDKTIILDKKDDNIVVKLEKDNYKIVSEDVFLNDNLNKIIDLLHICNKVRINIKGDNIKLYTSNYKDIFNNYLMRKDNYYIFNINVERDLYREISLFNKYKDIINYKEIDRVFSEFNVEDMVECINNQINNIYIVKNDYSINLYIDGDNYYLFVFKDKNMFDKVFLPELLRKYVDVFNVIEKTFIEGSINICYGNLNDNFYLINYSEEEIVGCFRFVKVICDNNNYKLDMNSDCIFIKEEDNYVKPSYSYGYISAIFISLIISIITIIITIMHL